MKYPTEKECLELLKEECVHQNVVGHSKRVAKVAIKLAEEFEKKGLEINKSLVLAGALLHDIKKLKLKNHAIRGAEHLERMGHFDIAEIAKKHAISSVRNHPPISWEERIVFYSDLRVNPGKIVSLDQRFSYIKKKYCINDEQLLEEGYLLAKEIENKMSIKLGINPEKLSFE